MCITLVLLYIAIARYKENAWHTTFTWLQLDILPVALQIDHDNTLIYLTAT